MTDKLLPHEQRDIPHLPEPVSTEGALMSDQIKHYSDKLAFETDSWDLKVAIEAGEQLVIIDPRSPQAYAHEHLPGSINIPHRTMSETATRHIDKSHLVVTYCDGIGCNASTKGALNMSRLGFTVKKLVGGLDWWKRDGHPTEGTSISPSGGGPSSCGCE